jgi:phosphoribosyl-AMP cyclohydrolase/phosphoribosyl-ATP pyrophosphohydrolase
MTVLPVRFDEEGLIPAVIQDADSGEVLMMAYMNADALEKTRETGKTHFWSRSRSKLWQKGETSGHVQLVRSIAVNCYENCLLIRVHQVGACCHTGYPTCFYREIDAHGNLVTFRDRSFDPAEVYAPPRDLESLVLRWVGAYRWLADHDLTSESTTSRHLRHGGVAELSARLGDELIELAGVLRGEHSHHTPEADILLEGSQALYWAVVTAMRAGLSDEQITSAIARRHQATSTDPAKALIVEASQWARIQPEEFEGRLLTVAGLVADAAATIELELGMVIKHDLADLQQRPYLADYFHAPDDAASPDS